MHVYEVRPRKDRRGVDLGPASIGDLGLTDTDLI